MERTNMWRNGILATLLVISMFLSFGTVNAIGIIDNVQSGTTTFAGTSDDVTITSVNTSSSVLFFTYTVDGNTPSGTLVRGDISSATNIHFERVAGTGTVSVAWYVAEFDSGVVVQSGTNTMAGTSNIQPITSVNTSSSFPIISWENTGSTLGTDDHARAQITSATQLTLDSSAAVTDTLAWQVVDFSDAIVQEGTTSITGTTATVDISNVNLSKSFILSQGLINANTGADDAGFVVNFTNASQISFEREASGGTVNVGYHVVELTGGENVQNGYASLDASTTQINVTINEVNTSRAVAFTSWKNQAGKGTETDDNLGVIFHTLELTNGTNLKIDRATVGTADTSDLQWFVVEFGGEINVAPNITTNVQLEPIGDPVAFNYTDLNGSGFIADNNSDPTLTVEIKWYNNSVAVIEQNFTGETSGATFSTVLNSTNTSIGETWIFSMRTYDGEFFSDWVNSTPILIRDPSAPVINITYPLNITYAQTITELNYTITNSSALNNCWYSTDQGANNISITCNQNVTSINSSEGDNIWTVYANDSNGNIGFNSIQFQVDTTAPTVSITSPGTFETDYSLPFNFTIGGGDLATAVVYSRDGGANVSVCTNCNGSFGEFIILEEGTTTFTVYANDSLGNTDSDSVTVTLDPGRYLFDTFTDNATISNFSSVELLEGNITFRSNPFRNLDVLLVCGAATCAVTTSDVAIHDFMVGLGHNVSNVSASDSSWNAADYDVVVISESVNSGDTAFMKTRDVPIVTLEGANNDEFDLGSSGGSNTDVSTSMTIQNNSNYITSQYSVSDNVLFSSVAGMGSIGGVSQDVHLLASASTNSGLGTIVVVEEGGTLTDLTTATNKRAYFAGFNFGALNTAGEELFERTLNWATDNTGTGATGVIISHPLNLTENITAFDNITWTEDNTNAGNNISVEVSVDGGSTWLNTTRDSGVFNFTQGSELVFRVNFTGNESRDIALLDLNISWADLDTPTVTLISPLNDSFIISNGTLNLTWFVTDSNSTVDCDLYINEILNLSSTCSTGVNSSVLVDIANGNYTWKVVVNDSDGNVENSSLGNFTIISGRNLTVEKNIAGGITNNFYIVTLNVTNQENQTLDVTLYDFVDTPEFIFGSFNRLYNFTNVTNGTEYNGTVLGWNLTILARESEVINYSIASTGNYRVGANWPFALD